MKKKYPSLDEVWESILKDHNHSWYEDIYLRNKDRKEHIALFYRNSTYSYGEFFEMAEKYAKSLKVLGVNKGDEFVACLQQTPDYPILIAAASIVGAKINLINSSFDIDYIGEIISRANANIVFICDWDFVKLSPAFSKMNKRIVVLPVDYWEREKNPYKEIQDRFCGFDKDEYQSKIINYDDILTTEEFIELGVSFSGEINGHGKLEDDLAITYTSGSTRKGVHKGVVQKNRTYIIMGRYHDPEVAGIPKMDNTWSMVAVGTHADTTLMSGVSDTLLQGGIVVLEPIICKDYFLYGLMFNRPGLVIATTTFWLHAMKETYNNPEFKNIKLPYLYVPSEGGEPLSGGEERALNKWLLKVGAGCRITHTPISVVKMTVGGGDSEHGSLFISLYRGYKNYRQKLRKIKEPIGLEYYRFAEVKCLKSDGTYCTPMEMGRLVANSPASMEHYHNDPEATDKYFVTDAYGKRWGDLGTYGYIDKWENVYIKGRIKSDDPVLKPFQISNVIQRDIRNIMSCEVIYFEKQDKYVAHVEFQYGKRTSDKERKILIRAYKRCIQVFGEELKGKLLFRIRSYEEGFPTLFTAKRNIIELKEEGINEKCIELLI